MICSPTIVTCQLRHVADVATVVPLGGKSVGLEGTQHRQNRAFRVEKTLIPPERENQGKSRKICAHQFSHHCDGDRLSILQTPEI